MLTQIRERASGWLAWVIVILITIPFALWGIQSYFQNAAEIPVATVNGEEIPLYAFQNEVSRRRQQLLRQANGQVDTALLESAGMRAEALEAMIATRLINQYVSELNYRSSDEELKRRIESTPSFLREGKFDAALYRELLRANGLTTKSYEAGERQNAAIAQLASALTDSAFATEAESNRLLQLQAQTREADYVILPANRFEADIEIESADIQRQYDDNAAAHQAPARIKADYIELSVARLAAGIEPFEAEISAIYQQTRGRYQQAEIRKASHILFSTEAPAAEDDNDENESAADAQTAEDGRLAKVLAKAEATLAEAQGGADFAGLAERDSDDPGSKNKGGDLGVVARGQMVAPFEAAVFDMTEGEIRGPIKTRFGYHIIQLTELTEQRQKLLPEVRAEVVAEAKRVQAESLFAEMGEAFENLVFESPDSLTIAADELGLEVQQTDWFTEQGAAGEADGGLAAEAAIRRAAFSEDVRIEGLNSAAIELGFDRMVAIRKADYEAARLKPFGAVREQIEQRLKTEQSRQRIKELGDKLIADLNGGLIHWDELLQQEQLESSVFGPQRGQMPANLANLDSAVFARAAPDSGATAYDGVLLDNGDYAIYALKAVTPGAVDSMDESQRARLQARLLARDGRGFYQQLLKTIRQTAEVSINQAQLQNPSALQ